MRLSHLAALAAWVFALACGAAYSGGDPTVPSEQITFQSRGDGDVEVLRIDARGSDFGQPTHARPPGEPSTPPPNTAELSVKGATGMGDIDTIREQVTRVPTDQQNLRNRRTALHRWWRFLWHQGYDMSAYDAVWNIVNNGGDDPTALKYIDKGFAGLEAIVASDQRIAEVRGSAAPSPTQTDWPAYHGIDGSQAGYSPDAGPSEGKIAWRLAKGNYWNAAPVAADGRIYVASPGADVVAYCLDGKSGEVVWKARQYGEQVYELPGAIHTPFVTEDTVLISTGWWQHSDHLVLDKENGRLRSRTPAAGLGAGSAERIMAFKHNRSFVAMSDARTGEGVRAFNAGGYLSGEPIVVGDRVYAAQEDGWVFGFLHPEQGEPSWQVDLGTALRGVIGAGNARLFIGDTDRVLHAVGEVDGLEEWTFRAEEVEDKAYQYFSTAVEANGRVYVGAASSHVYCLNAETGVLIWKHPVSDWIRAKPVVVGGVVHVATLSGAMHALRDTGDCATEVWQAQLGEHGFTADLVATDEGILASGRDLVLYSVSPTDGAVQWRHSIIDGAWVDGVRHRADVVAGQYQASPTVADGVVYVGGPDGFLDAVDVETGARLWRFETHGRISCAPRIAEGKVFLGKNAHHDEFYAIDQKTGEPVWTIEDLGWTSLGAPGYADGMVFVGTVEGTMFGVDASDGAVVWERATGKGIYPSPATDDTNVYTGSHDGHYYAFDQKTGDVAWKTFTANPEGHGGLPDSAATVLLGDHVYAQKRGASIVALSKDTGEEAWSWTQPANYLQNGTVAAAHGRIYGSVVRLVTAIPYYASIHAFDDVANGGSELWSYSDGGGGGGLTAPVATDDKLIFGSSAGVFVTCLDPSDGSLKWRCYVGGPMEESVPAIYGDKAFFHCRNGYVYAVQ
jgi:outer membrane protein assembly factor BamB